MNNLTRRLQRIEQQAGMDKPDRPPTSEEYREAERRQQARCLIDNWAWWQELGIENHMRQGVTYEGESRLLEGDTNKRRQADERVIELGYPMYGTNLVLEEYHAKEERLYALTEKRLRARLSEYITDDNELEYAAWLFTYLLYNTRLDGFVQWARRESVPEYMINATSDVWYMSIFEVKGRFSCWLQLPSINSVEQSHAERARIEARIVDLIHDEDEDLLSRVKLGKEMLFKYWDSDLQHVPAGLEGYTALLEERIGGNTILPTCSR